MDKAQFAFTVPVNHQTAPNGGTEFLPNIREGGASALLRRSRQAELHGRFVAWKNQQAADFRNAPSYIEAERLYIEWQRAENDRAAAAERLREATAERRGKLLAGADATPTVAEVRELRGELEAAVESANLIADAVRDARQAAERDFATAYAPVHQATVLEVQQAREQAVQQIFATAGLYAVLADALLAESVLAAPAFATPPALPWTGPLPAVQPAPTPPPVAATPPAAPTTPRTLADVNRCTRPKCEGKLTLRCRFNEMPEMACERCGQQGPADHPILVKERAAFQAKQRAPVLAGR